MFIDQLVVDVCQVICISAVKQSAKVVMWAGFSGKSGRGGIWFAKPGETVNATAYRQTLEEK